MKANFTLFDPIQMEGKCAVMTGEDTDVEATQFRGSDGTPAGSFHKDHVRIADDRPPEPRRGGQNTKRDEGTNRIVPPIVVAEQWLCSLLGLICVICGVCGLFMKYNQDSPLACIRWLGSAHGPILRFTAVACCAVGAALVRCGLASPDHLLVSIDQNPLRSVRANSVRASNLFSAWGRILGFGLKWKGKDHHERRHI
jgi:hypothetical protein